MTKSEWYPWNVFNGIFPLSPRLLLRTKLFICACIDKATGGGWIAKRYKIEYVNIIMVRPPRKRITVNVYYICINTTIYSTQISLFPREKIYLYYLHLLWHEWKKNCVGDFISTKQRKRPIHIIFIIMYSFSNIIYPFIVNWIDKRQRNSCRRSHM